MKDFSKYAEFLADCAYFFDWEDMPYYTLSEGFDTLKARFDIDDVAMTRMVKKMARLGIVVDYSFTQNSVFVAIDKNMARLFLSRPRVS